MSDGRLSRGMPIPAQPDVPTVSGAVVALFRQLHDQIRLELAELTDDDVNWVPMPGANCIATLVTHLLGSESESVSVAAGWDGQRDREAEFTSGATTLDDLHRLLDAADMSLATASPELEARLWQRQSLPTLPNDEVRPSITWLMGNYGHAREHLGHLQLTRDLRRDIHR